ncbi:hypothetical protein SAMN04488128_1021671 [Chitinophaga eiseniae]|uniref:Uncharacterized protein n=1 Tax=Chitinophaga eiseniae TaxID=634771 RepID=A0A1T4S1L2_9BACT|nr:hypothetical protein SAMN04488128_1021671 [Chitinophaga eiseniae]
MNETKAKIFQIRPGITEIADFVWFMIKKNRVA